MSEGSGGPAAVRSHAESCLSWASTSSLQPVLARSIPATASEKETSLGF